MTSETIPIPTIRALIWIKEPSREITFDLELNDCEIDLSSKYSDTGLFRTDQVFLATAMPDRIAIEGRSKRTSIEVGSWPYEEGLVKRFQELWDSHGGGDHHARQQALNFYLAAHGLGPFSAKPK